MMLYLLAIRTLFLSLTHLFSSRHLAAGFGGLTVLSLALVSGTETSLSVISQL